MTCLKVFCLLLVFVSHSFARDKSDVAHGGTTVTKRTTRPRTVLTLPQEKPQDNRDFLHIVNNDEPKKGDLSQSAQQSHLDRYIITGCTAAGAFGGYIVYHSLFGDVSSSISQSFTSMAYQTATDPGTLGGALIGAFVAGVIVREKNIAQGKLTPSVWGFLSALKDYTSETISYGIQTPTDWACELLDGCARRLRRETHD